MKIKRNKNRISVVRNARQTFNPFSFDSESLVVATAAAVARVSLVTIKRNLKYSSNCMYSHFVSISIHIVSIVLYRLVPKNLPNILQLFTIFYVTIFIVLGRSSFGIHSVQRRPTSHCISPTQRNMRNILISFLCQRKKTEKKWKTIRFRLLHRLYLFPTFSQLRYPLDRGDGGEEVRKTNKNPKKDKTFIRFACGVCGKTQDMTHETRDNYSMTRSVL